MKSVPIPTLVKLQKETQLVRNISIVAHVDHGKTTLTDSLISSNGIFSSRNAGRIRYMDYTEQEQERGITMKSASISLMHRFHGKDHLINLIDSPGHVDFTTEVSSALRVTDGAIVVLDAIEGVCIQTRVVLRQAWHERVRPVLFINKIDKLITKLNHDAVQAFEHIKKLLTSINEVTASLANEEKFMFLAEQSDNATGVVTEDAYDLDLDSDDRDEWFCPSKGNVVFGSALGGWGFGIDEFVNIYVEKLGVKGDILRKVLWGDFYYDAQKKVIYKKKPKPNSVPMFVNFILKPIWSVYQALMPQRNEEQIQKIVSSLKIDLPQRDLRDTNSPGQVVANILSKWLPLSNAVLNMVVNKLPNPIDAQKERIPYLVKKATLSSSSTTDEKVETAVTNEGEASHTHEEDLASQEKAQEKLFQSIKACRANDENVVAFVAKVFTVPNDHLIGIRRPGDKTAPHLDPHGMSFIGMGRIFSGTLKRGMKIHVLGPKYQPSRPTKHVTTIEVEDLFILMGRSYEPIDEVPAGNVFGISGIETHILKTATLSSSLLCSSFDQMQTVAAPIVRVAVEPVATSDFPKLEEGMRLLNIADPGAEVFIQKTGEYIIAASGELHLNRCLNDLEERFAKVKLTASQPIVLFKETITMDLNRGDPDEQEKQEETETREDEDDDDEFDMDGVPIKKPEKTTEFDPASVFPTPLGPAEIVVKTMDSSMFFRIVAEPLPLSITKFLEEHTAQTDLYMRALKGLTVTSDTDLRVSSEASSEYRASLKAVFDEAGEPWASNFERVWAFGPGRCGPNVLLNEMASFADTPFWTSPLSEKAAKPLRAGVPEADALSAEDRDRLAKLLSVEGSIIAGFSLACDAGPLCMEPMIGVVFKIVDIKVDLKVDSEIMSSKFGPLSGQVISAVKDGCKKAFLKRSQRLVQPMYDCSVQVFGSEHIGKAYGVLAKRRAQIRREDWKEGSDICEIYAYMPVAESFGFAEELFKTTSGAGHGQLVFSHWEILDEDPNFVPQTEEELLMDGYNAANVGLHLARQYIDNTRRRKGLPVKEKKVEANKQRTLAKKK